MSRVYPRGPVRIGSNMTPMVDIVFQLIVFFVLVAHISSAEHVELTLSRLTDARTAEPPREGRIVINVLPAAPDDPAGPALYRVGVRTFDGSAEGLGALTELLQLAQARDPSVEALVRAARTAPYARVRPALQACADAGVTRTNLVVEPEPRNGARP